MRFRNHENVTDVDRVSDAVPAAVTDRTTTAQQMYKFYPKSRCGRRMRGGCHLRDEQTEECKRRTTHVPFDT